MVALALSSSLYEQERALHPESASHPAVTPSLKWSSDAGTTAGAFALRPQTHHLFPPLIHLGKGRRKKKKGAVPGPPPLLLAQDAAAALNRLQERVSALLLRHRPPSPPTPTRCPSSLSGWSGAAPLWQRSSLLEDQSDFYTHELRAFFLISEAETVGSAVRNRFQ